MVEDRRLTISSSGRLHPDEIARRTFATSRRGFDPSEVRAFLEQVGREAAEAREVEQGLRESLAEAEHRAENPVLDEPTITTALGQETARVLHSAHEVAAELVARAEGHAETTVSEAREEVEKLRAQSEKNAADETARSEADAAQTRRRAQEDASSALETARAESEAILEQTRSECRSMLSEAQELRARVLSDLTRRRRVLHTQIEQLRAGRETLAQTISAVRHTVERVSDELINAEDEARMAAEAAGRQQAQAQSTAEPVDTPLETARSLQEAATPPEEPGTVASSEEVFAGIGDSPRAGPTIEPRETKEQAVEELFARLRSESTREARDGHSISDADESGSAGGAEALSEARIQEASRATDVEEPAGSAGATDGAAASSTAALVVRRDEVLTPIAATLARRLKRALTDDQNDILDRIRANKGRSPDLLAAQKDQAERYSRASAESLSEAAQAGALFAGGKAADAPAVEDLANELAASVVVPLRRRLEGDHSSNGNGDEAFLVEQVGAAFRDWKGARIERLASDEAVAAFSRGELAVSDKKGAFRWVVDDDGVECPDCDDNALAGPVPRGDLFPTGHPHPPAHSGCRCLLAPIDA